MEDENADRVYVPGTNGTPPDRDVEPFWPPEELNAPVHGGQPVPRDAPPAFPLPPVSAPPQGDPGFYRPADRAVTPPPAPQTYHEQAPRPQVTRQPPEPEAGGVQPWPTIAPRTGPAAASTPDSGHYSGSAHVSHTSSQRAGSVAPVSGASREPGLSTPVGGGPSATSPGPASDTPVADGPSAHASALGAPVSGGQRPDAPTVTDSPWAQPPQRPTQAEGGPVPGPRSSTESSGPPARNEAVSHSRPAHFPTVTPRNTTESSDEPHPGAVYRPGPVGPNNPRPNGSQPGPVSSVPNQVAPIAPGPNPAGSRPGGPTPPGPNGPGPHQAGPTPPQHPGPAHPGPAHPGPAHPGPQQPGPPHPGSQEPGPQHGQPHQGQPAPWPVEQQPWMTNGQPPPVPGPFPPTIDPRAVSPHPQPPRQGEQPPGPNQPPPVDPYQQLPWVSDGMPTAEEFARRRLAKPAEPTATMGARAILQKGTMGLVKLAPGKREQEYKQDVEMVRRNFGGLRQVTVVNPKGGAGKTVAVLLLAMTFGQKRGGYVLAWDNNETQGTLGMRAQQDFHARTVRDMMRDLHLFRGSHGRVGDLSQYVRAQGEGMFDVLASDESATAGEMLTASAFAEIREIVSRFYKLIFVDTGNNVRAQNWQAAMDATDQLVITMSARNDSAETAARMLDHLEQSGRQRLVRQAVSVVTMPPTRKDIDLPAIQRHFAARTRAVLLAPYEKLIDSGEPLRYGHLSNGTRDSWLKIAAAVAEGL